MHMSYRNIHEFLYISAGVPPVPTGGIHRHGRHHHATEAVLDAPSVSHDVVTGVQAGRLSVVLNIVK